MEFKIPSPLSLNGNLASNFKKFKINFEIYMKATGHNNKDSSTKTAILLNVLGEEAIELFQTFDLKDEERSDYEKVFKAFEDYTIPQTNIVMERFKFNSRSQHSGEPFESFVTDLRKLIKSCDFGNQMDSLLRDRIILGIDEDRPNVVNNVPVQPLPDRPIEVVAQPQNRPNNPYQTRSGRTVRPPKRFQ